MNPGGKVIQRFALHLPPQVRLKRVLDMLDAPPRKSRPTLNRNNVKSARALPQAMMAEVEAGQLCQLALLFRIDRGKGTAEELTGPGLDLDERDRPSPFDHEVDLSSGAAPIAVPNPIPLERQPASRSQLTSLAETVASILHNLRTPPDPILR